MAIKDDYDFEELDDELNSQIDEKFKELEKHQSIRNQIKDKNRLVDSISQMVWEQFILQIAGEAGEEFIKNNNNLKLSIKKSDHYINKSSFKKGDLPKHNFKNMDTYQKRYDFYDSLYTDSSHEHLSKNYRKHFDLHRLKGSGNMSMDHTIPIKHLIRDDDVVTYFNPDEIVRFANDPNKNLKPLDREANQSKGDMKMEDWLKSKRVDKMHPNGATPEERFGKERVNSEELLDRGKRSDEALDNEKTTNKQRANNEGKESRLAEANRAATFAFQAIAVALLAKLTKNIFNELFKWLSKKDKHVKDLLRSFKKAIYDFLTDFKNNIILTIDVGVTVLLTEIFGKIITVIRKALLFFQIGGKTLIDARKYINDPKNKNKEPSVVTYELGSIVVMGLTTAASIGLGMIITAGLSALCPPLAVPIPLIGSAAGLLGIFFGGLTAGVCGAIVLYKMENNLKDSQLSENLNKQIQLNNDILSLQKVQFSMYDANLEKRTNEVKNNISSNMKFAVDEMKKNRDSLNETNHSENENKLKKISSELDDID